MEDKDIKNLLDILLEYDETKIPMHMPGHKRNLSISSHSDYLEKLCAKADVTEAYGLDDLHNAKGIIKESMMEASKLWDAKSSYYLVNGSTVGNLASIYSMTKSGDKVLVTRNCHKSVYHAMEIAHLNAVFLDVDIDDNGFFHEVNIEKFRKKVGENQDAKLVIITSPTFEGVVSDIQSIADITHDYGMYLIVDEAHGAHFGFHSYFPQTAVRCGADFVIQSLHKTLPSLTQTAILHLNVDNTIENRVKRSLNIFETSSPSYLLMSSIDGCINLIREDGEKLFENWYHNLADFREKVKDLNKLHILEKRDVKGFDYDNSKIVILTSGSNISGIRLSNILREDYDIEIEMASLYYCIAYTGLGDRREDILAFADALLDIDSKLNEDERQIPEKFTEIPKKKMLISQALDGNIELVKIEDSINRVAADYVWAYPPGIPMVVPGEIVDVRLLKQMQMYIENGVNIIFSKGTGPEYIAVLKEI